MQYNSNAILMNDSALGLHGSPWMSRTLNWRTTKTISTFQQSEPQCFDSGGLNSAFFIQLPNTYGCIRCFRKL